MTQIDMDKEIEYLDQQLEQIRSQVRIDSERELRNYWKERGYVKEARWRKYSPAIAMLVAAVVSWLAVVGVYAIVGWFRG